MYKLTIVSGPNRGTSYPVHEGEVSIGRQSGNGIVLQSSKVSKRHCVLTVDNGEVTIKDQGSSNGTFVNGILTKLKKISPGDRISVGEYVFELAQPQKSAGNVPAVAGMGNVLQFPSPAGANGLSADGLGGVNDLDPLKNPPPKDLKAKVIWAFENRFMPIFYSMNLKTEWKIICIEVLAVFIFGNLFISVYPLMESNRASLVKETERRARFMARQIAEQNAPFIAQRAETKAEIGLTERAEGVRVAVLTDLDSRIIAPGSKINQYLTGGEEARFARKARDRFQEGRETGIVVETSDSVIAIEPLKVLSPNEGKNVVVAMAIVSIDTTLSTPDPGEMAVVYSETLIFTGILGALLFLILYRLTLKPFQVLNEDMDKALKGDLSQVTHEFKFQEMDSLWDIINSAIQRIPKSESAANALAESNLNNSDEYLGPVQMLGNIAKFGLVLFDSQQKIVYLNALFEEISGIRQDGALGQEMSQVARDQSMGAFTADLLSRTPVGGEGLREDYDFSGISYKMHSSAFGSPGGNARCFLLAAVRVEEIS